MAKKAILRSYENGSYTVGFKQEIIPTGTKSITENGTYDVSDYASASVSVEGGGTEDMDGIEELVSKGYYRTKEYTFAYGTLPHAQIVLMVDDCLPNVISDCVTNAIAKNVPLGMGAISGYFNDMCTHGATNKTVLEEIKRGINAGGEVFLHGNGSITADNIDDEDYLKTKFLDEKLVFNENGLYPRGAIVIGGGSEIYNDARTDRWVRALYDYSDGWGIGEPYSHRRLAPTTLEAAKTYIDDAVANNKFIVIFAHKWYNFWNDMIDYAKGLGAEFTTWGAVIDAYGTKTYTPPEKTLVGITATKTTTSYITGSQLATNDIVVTASWSDSTTTVVTSESTIDTSQVNMQSAGNYNINISYTYGGRTSTTAIGITVTESPSGTIIYQTASISANCVVGSDKRFGTSVNFDKSKSYRYQFDWEVTAVQDDTTTVSIRAVDSKDLGINKTNATVGQTGSCNRTITPSNTRSREPFVLKEDGKAYSVKLTNVVVTQLN